MWFILPILTGLGGFFLGRKVVEEKKAEREATIQKEEKTLTVDGHGTGVVLEGQKGIVSSSVKSPETFAAETVKLQIVEALNTPQGDRTPEQLALLLGVAGLPTV